MALTAERPPVGELQVALRPLQRLDRRLLVDAQNDGILGRRQVEADDIGRLGGELGVVALAPRLLSVQIDPLVTQEAPDLLFVNVAKLGRDQRPHPACEPRRRRTFQDRQDAAAGLGGVLRLRSGTRLVGQPGQALAGIARAPGAHRVGHHSKLIGYRARRAPLSSQQDDTRAKRIALGRGQRANPSLEHRPILPTQPDFYCSGNHPDVES
jgi:hypothetical protein